MAVAKRKPKKAPVKRVVHVRSAPKRSDKSGSKPKRREKPKMAIDKDDDRTAAEKAKTAADKTAADKTAADKAAAAKDTVTPTVAAPEDMMTEQEKDTSAGVHGVGPVVPAAHSTGPVETIEDLGIGPREPYPEGNPPADSEVITRSQGINRGDQPEARDTPNKARAKDPTR